MREFTEIEKEAARKEFSSEIVFSTDVDGSCCTTEYESMSSKRVVDFVIHSQCEDGNPTTKRLSKNLFKRLSHELSEALSERTSQSFGVILSPLHKVLIRTAREELSERKSTLFCGSCCDLVRGCTVVNILNICITITFLVICLLDVPQIHQLMLAVADEGEEEYGGIQAVLDPRGTLGLVRTSMMLPAALLGIVGAQNLNRNMVLCAAVWYSIDLILGVSIMAWTNVVLSAFYCYPHIHLFLELKSDRITTENYYQTEQYCCCSCCYSAAKWENVQDEEYGDGEIENVVP